MFASSSDQAHIAYAPKTEQRVLLDLLAQSDDSADALARDPARAAKLIDATRRRGYGLPQGGLLWPHTGALALPVRVGRRVLGCINTVWMARVISVREGVRRCLEPLRETRQRIEQELLEARHG